MKRTIGILGHAAIAGVILAWSIWAGYTFWRGLFGSDWAAIGALLALDAAALWGFVMHVLTIPSPFARVRHALPLLSALPLLHSLHALAANAGDVVSWAAALALTALLALFSWLAWRGLERLLIDPASVQEAELIEQERRASAAVRRIAAEAAMTMKIIAAMREAVTQHERLLLQDPTPALLPRQATYPEPVPASAMPEHDGLSASETLNKTSTYVCPRCGHTLTLGQYGSAVRRGYCRHCRSKKDA